MSNQWTLVQPMNHVIAFQRVSSTGEPRYFFVNVLDAAGGIITFFGLGQGSPNFVSPVGIARTLTIKCYVQIPGTQNTFAAEVSVSQLQPDNWEVVLRGADAAVVTLVQASPRQNFLSSDKGELQCYVPKALGISHKVP